MITQIAYLDCPTGISGDMCLGALIDAGVPLEYLTQQLARLGITEEYQLRSASVHRNGQAATKVEVELPAIGSADRSVPTATVQSTNAIAAIPRSVPHPDRSHHSNHHLDHPHHSEHHHHSQNDPHGHSHDQPSHTHHGTRHLPEIERLILSAQLPDRVTQWSLAIFRQLAKAEGAVHGIPPEQVHFHEVGATDAIVDIVGTCLGFDYLGIDRLYCSALPMGGGTVWAAHGRLPVPAPAVLKLFEMGQVPIYSNGIDKELVTPTGAAIVTTLATQIGAPPSMRLQKVGLGAGSKDLPIPNILRLWIGTIDQTEQQKKEAIQIQGAAAALAPVAPIDLASGTSVHQSNAWTQETVAVLETQIDDLNPQAIGYVMTELLTAGALDVFTQAIGMKKSRPGILLTVICRPDQVPSCEMILFRETTTLGIRHTEQQRSILERAIESVETPYGSVQVKVARSTAGKVLNVQPEYEDCAHLAQDHHLPWREVHRAALQTWYCKTNNAATNC